MRRKYNARLSYTVNRQLSRRYRTAHIHRQMLILVIIVFVSACILLGTSIRIFAGSSHSASAVQTYYTSIQVEEGDTLWTIADKYMEGSNLTKREYIDEICRLNSLQNDKIHSGEYLIVSYYEAAGK